MFVSLTKNSDTEPIANKPYSIGFIVCAGILLPLITLIVEISTKMCADGFFDPIPSVWHVLIVALVPLANTQLLWSLYQNKFERITFLSWISAISAGAAIFYSLKHASQSYAISLQDFSAPSAEFML